MSEEQFLARWSRRKSEARAATAAPEAVEPGEAQPTSPPAVIEASDADPEIDLSTLPPIDSITAATDITAFLRKGIPQELTRAALRRAWTADPAIRDFVGLAENAWDFNDPAAMPGFGPLDCTEAELSELVERIVGGVRKAAETLPDAVQVADSTHDAAEESVSTEAIADTEPAEEPKRLGSPQISAAPQPLVGETTESEDAPVRPRTHGGALPR
jgi:hypothetical protein